MLIMMILMLLLYYIHILHSHNYTVRTPNILAYVYIFIYFFIILFINIKSYFNLINIYHSNDNTLLVRLTVVASSMIEDRGRGLA